MKLRIGCVVVGFLSLVLSLVQLTFAQMPTQTASALPRLVRFSGAVKDLGGTPLTGVVGITFALYSEQTGGAALWQETQNATADSGGHYTALLGSTKPDGLPPDLFTSEQARWVGVQVSGQPEQPRVLLVAVPYAMKAADAETVGGLPPSAFVLAAPVSSSATLNGAAASNTNTPSVTPPPASGVTTTGGTVNAIPLFTTATNIQNSAIAQTGTGTTARIGIGTATPAATLDIKGAATVRGVLTLPATGAATATAGKNSQPESLIASSFSSSTSTGVNQVFRWQAEPAANNTANPSGTLNLLYGLGATPPSETGLKINSKGVFTFAAGQVFPGTGTITGVTAGTDLTGGGGTGVVTLNLNTTATDARYARLATANTFTGNQSVSGNLTATGSVTGGSLNGNGAGVTNVNAALLGGFAPSAFATVGANSFSGTQTITSGDLSVSAGSIDLPLTNRSGTGVINIGGYPFIHDCCNTNTFVGFFAGNLSTGGDENVGIGNSALSRNNSGSVNAAFGSNALALNSEGAFNTAIGAQTMGSNLTGCCNVALGFDGLTQSTGSYNTALGYVAGYNLTSGDNNIYIGNQGLSSESNTIRIGTGGGGTNPHTAIYLAAVLGTTVTSGQQVYIGYDGRLGTINSSRRYKDDIKDMGEASRGLLKLRPVTFRYKQTAPDGSKPLQYGLIAEEVADVYPDAVGYNAGGQPDSVEYHKINAMLINEVQRQNREIEELKADLETKDRSLEDLKASLAELKALVQNQLGR
jgi:hypothetical protein